MLSERRLKTRVLVSVAVLALAAAELGADWAWRQAWTIWLLVVVLAALELLRNLAMLTAPGVTPSRASQLRAGEAPDDPAAAWLRYAPIALFRIDLDDGGGAAVALNASAHRVLVHGYAGEHGELHETLRRQQVGQRTLVWFNGEHGAERVLLTAAALTTGEGRQQLVAWMPVENELEAETLSAWRELTHVLTHEIMNSLTPVVSLSHSAQELLETVHALLPEDVNEDLSITFATIERRATSLHAFVDSYRTLSAMPEPRPETMLLRQVFGRLATLIGADWLARGGRAEFIVEPDTLTLEVDPGQFEQAMINLLANAADATAGGSGPLVRVTARQHRGGRVQIDVWDNGPGIPDELAAQIFVPFFSTKERGSGVGLAVVRQLLHGNGGAVRYVKPVRGGAQFSVTF